MELSDGHWQCRSCPEQTSGAEPGFHEPWVVKGAIFGHFSQTRHRQALLSSGSCEPHAGGGKGTFLLTETDGRWQVTSYTRVLDVSKCSAFRKRSGLDLLLCQDSWGFVSANGDILNEVDYAAKADQPFKELVSTMTTSMCGTKSYWQEAGIEDVRVAGERIVVRASYGRVPFKTPEECKPIEELPLRTYRIVFRFDGSHFRLVYGGRALKLLEAHE